MQQREGQAMSDPTPAPNCDGIGWLYLIMTIIGVVLIMMTRKEDK